RGSAGVDLAVATTITLRDNRVQVVPSTEKGPLGGGLSALLIGRSSISKQGIFVLPGLIDSDYTSTIMIMVTTFAPPVVIPAGSKLAQLIPFQGQAPKTETTRIRGDGAFGSTNNLVLFAQHIQAQRPTREVTIDILNSSYQQQNMQVSMMMDTASDITIIP
ncbi:POK9 protein, partial [Mystacornis crossleyi]|nr:POK9 protein [Mystacornis crossleyi]